MMNSTKNYDIVQEKYTTGTATITHLIDAQRDKFTRESDAVIAVYDFLQDLSTLDRAVSRFWFFSSEEERQNFTNNMEEYFAANGVTLNLEDKNILGR